MAEETRNSIADACSAYSLRPRSIISRNETSSRRRRESQDGDTDEPDDNNSHSSKRNTKKQKQNNNSKSKQRPAPLSKYRRKNANARERQRMHEINMALEALRKLVPSFVGTTTNDTCSENSTTSQQSSNSSSNNNKDSSQLTKITTIRLAMNYIRILSDMLDQSRSSSSADTNSGQSSPSCSTTISGPLPPVETLLRRHSNPAAFAIDFDIDDQTASSEFFNSLGSPLYAPAFESDGESITISSASDFSDQQTP
jgi:bHLH factor